MYQNFDLSSFCILPWIHLSIGMAGEITPCCINKEIIGKSEDLENQISSEFLNSQALKDIRKSMMSGTLPESCNFCSSISKIPNAKSLKDNKNSRWRNILSPSELEIINSTLPDGTITNPKILYVDIRNSNICNLKCRTCGPTYSSKIQAEEKITFSQNEFKLSDNLEVLKDLKEIYFASGEPLINSEHYKVLNLINTDTSLVYNTNFTVSSFKDQNVFDHWTKFDKLTVMVSLDDIGDRLQYLRNGANYSSILENFRRFHSVIPNSRRKIGISITVSIFNILYLDEIVNDILDKDLVDEDLIKLNFVLEPFYFRCDNFIGLINRDLEDTITKIKSERCKSPLQSLLNKNNFKINEKAVEHFYQKVQEKDRLRNENFAITYEKLNKILHNNFNN